MYHKETIMIFPLLFLIGALVLSGCSTLIQPTTNSDALPTPVVSVEQGGEEISDVNIDPAEFKDALLEAISVRDREKLQMWMTEPFLTGTWRADLSDTPPADALNSLYASELGVDNQLSLVEDVDLKALMAGNDPLSIPRAEAGVVEAALISGWGPDGLDEAVLFIARLPDNSLKWHGWMRINGGLSGARFGGVQAYKNDALGFSVYLPKDYEIVENSDHYVSIIAPLVEGAGHPGIASITVEPANGRTAEAAAQQAYLEGVELRGESTDISMVALGMDVTTGFVVFGLPGQDFNRQLFMVHNDMLYHIMFSPDEPGKSVSYTQMVNMYAMITNTFDFTQ